MALETGIELLERYERAKAENDRLKGISPHSEPLSSTSEEHGDYERMLKRNSRFKAFCRRRSDVRMATEEQRTKAARRARASELKAYCRPRGILSILKENEYCTGREIRITWPEKDVNGDPVVSTTWERAKIFRVGRKSPDWDSEILTTYENCEVETISQNILDFGKDPPNPDEKAEETEPDELTAEIEAVAKLMGAIEQQNALLRQLAA